MSTRINPAEGIKTERAVIQQVSLPGIENRTNIFIKREDLIHPAISGNKWYKLKYNIQRANDDGSDTLLTFGGAYSNHIYAVAAAGRIFGFKTIGMIRGEEHLPLNPTLSFAVNNGMEIHYVKRSDYRRKTEVEFLNKIRDQFGDAYIIPEGGTNELAIKGAAEILENINLDYDLITVPCGTGGTIAGITSAMAEGKRALGFAVLKGGAFLKDNVHHLLESIGKSEKNNWDINLEYHFGGYAKINRELIEFIEEFESLNGIPLDPVYTGKMFYGLKDLLIKKVLSSEDKILAVHTGGLQGIEGMRPQIENLLAK